MIGAPEQPSTTPGFIWRFANARYDENARELHVDGDRVHAEAKLLDVLALLLQYSGEVLTKEELAEAVWSRRVIDDAVVTKAIGKLRALLGPNGRKIIRTVHGVGYQLVADVEREPLRSARVSSLVDIQPGQQLAMRPGWELLRELGRGGHGSAWLTECRQTGELRVFKFALDRRGISALKREVTLQRLFERSIGTHAGIQGLLNWNLSTAPFHLEFEYAKAGSLQDWAESGGLSEMDRPQRLELLARIADALAVAHDVGVLHKDLKPSNILIFPGDDNIPQPRLMDFGSGEVLRSEQLEELRITRLGFTRDIDLENSPEMGSLLYLAPEILGGQVATSRSDLFALGTIVYQVIIGDLNRPVAGGWEREIDDEILVKDIAACLEGEPERRLSNAADFAQRLRHLDTRRQHWLKEQEQKQRETQLSEQLARQRIHRHWLIAVVIGLTLFSSMTVGLYLRAIEAERQAQEQSQLSASVNSFLLQDLLAASDPERTGQREMTLHQLLLTAEQGLSSRFDGQPQIHAAIRKGIGDMLRGVGDYRASLVQLKQARDLLHGLSPSRLQQEETALSLAQTLLRLSQYEQARIALAEVLKRPPGKAPDSLRYFEAQLLAEQIRFEEIGSDAKQLDDLDRLAQEMESSLGSDHPLMPVLLSTRANVLMQSSQHLPALHARMEAMDAYERQYGVDHPQTLRADIELGWIVGLNHQAGIGSEGLRRSVKAAHQTFGPEHGLTLHALSNLASWLYYDDQFEEAESLLRKALPIQRELFGATHALTISMQNDLANVLGDAGRFDEALEIYEQLLPSVVERYNETHIEVLRTIYNMAVTLKQAERFDQSLALSEQWRPRIESEIPHSAILPALLMSMAECALGLHQTERASAYLAEATVLMQSWSERGWQHLQERLLLLRQRLDE